MSVAAGLAYGKFLESDEIHHHPTLPLYVIGRWYGRNTATGDASGGTVSASLCPPNLPDGYPQDFFFTIYNLLLSGGVGSGAVHQLDAYSDDWEGAANQRMVCQVAGVDTASENIPAPTSIPFWLAWLIRRITDGNGVGSIKMTWLTNVLAGVHLLHASGIVLLDHTIMPEFLRKRIVRL